MSRLLPRNAPTSAPAPDLIAPLPVRLFFYLALIGGVFQIISILARTPGRNILQEGGLIENLQIVVLVLVAGGLLLAGRSSPRGRPRLYQLLAALAVCAIGRELDDSYPYRAIPNTVRILAAVVFVGGVAIRARACLREEIRSLLRRPAAVLFVVGIALVACWAQVLGERPLWRQFGCSTMGKRMVEENLEFAGYSLIALGVIEEWLHSRRVDR